ncbi:MAG: hypothetical protein IH571_01940, partial [Acholeplasmataceae bacterium]|nr:hypothetical protein [Acholeplasmataceae bacterium]
MEYVIIGLEILIVILLGFGLFIFYKNKKGVSNDGLSVQRQDLSDLKVYL